MDTKYTNYDRENTIMNLAIKRMVDYLYEESFFIDKEVIKDDETYAKLFKEIYEIFRKNDISNFYTEEMKLFIAYCVIENNDIDVNVLVENLLFLKDDMKMKKHLIPDMDLENIKDEYDQKTKVLKAS